MACAATSRTVGRERWPSRTMGTEASTPTTIVPSPAARIAASATTPVPVPTSRTRSPGRIPATVTRSAATRDVRGEWTRSYGSATWS